MLNGKWKYEHLWVNPWQIISRCYFLGCVDSFWKLLACETNMRCSSSVGVVPVFSFRGSSGQTRLAGKSLYWISQQENHLQTEVFCMLWLKTKHVFFSTWTVQSFVVQYAAIQQLIHDVVLRCRSSSKSLQYSSKRCLWRVDGCDSLQ